MASLAIEERGPTATVGSDEPIIVKAHEQCCLRITFDGERSEWLIERLTQRFRFNSGHGQTLPIFEATVRIPS